MKADKSLYLQLGTDKALKLRNCGNNSKLNVSVEIPLATPCDDS